jgi:hypothetical protein
MNKRIDSQNQDAMIFLSNYGVDFKSLVENNKENQNYIDNHELWARSFNNDASVVSGIQVIKDKRMQ